MVQINTVQSPRELLNKIYYQLRRAYGAVASAKDVEGQERVLQEIGILENLVEKLNVAELKVLSSEVDQNKESFAELDQLEKLLSEILDEKQQSVHNSHDIFRLTKAIRKKVKRQKRKTKATGERKIVNLKKEQQKIEKEKQEASEMTGKKVA